MQILENQKQLSDGIYSVPESCFILEVDFKTETSKILDFLKDYPYCVVASAYETDTTLVLSEEPEKLDSIEVVGSGFNYGSTNVIKNCPNTILILAEND